MLEFFFVKGRPRMLELWREFDLMPPQQMMLGLLDEPQPMGELAKHMHCDNSNITGIVDRLTERGLVERRAAEGDRRVKLVALTDAGRELRDELIRRRSIRPTRSRRSRGRPAQAAARSSPRHGGDPRAIVSAPWRTSAHPISYLTLAERARRCYSSDGKRLGKVEHVLADLARRHLRRSRHRPQRAPRRPSVRRRRRRSTQIYERGVRARASTPRRRSACPSRAKSAAAMEVSGEDLVEREWDDELEAKLKRAWDRLSGKAP